jgi:nucleotidyltransferase/DNA polymerase involved in DNA repair
MRFACLLIEHLPTRVETLHEPALSGRPLVVLRDWDSRVLDASPKALAAGVTFGDSRQRVEQLCPQAVICPAHETLYQSHHATLRNILAQFANTVESGDWGELTIELSALARSFSSEGVLALQLIQQLDQATPLQPTLGLASNKFTARQAAQQVGAQPGRVLSCPLAASAASSKRCR